MVMRYHLLKKLQILKLALQNFYEILKTYYMLLVVVSATDIVITIIRMQIVNVLEMSKQVSFRHDFQAPLKHSTQNS